MVFLKKAQKERKKNENKETIRKERASEKNSELTLNEEGKLIQESNQ